MRPCPSLQYGGTSICGASNSMRFGWLPDFQRTTFIHRGFRLAHLATFKTFATCQLTGRTGTKKSNSVRFGWLAGFFIELPSFSGVSGWLTFRTTFFLRGFRLTHIATFKTFCHMPITGQTDEKSWLVCRFPKNYLHTQRFQAWVT
jgi:hypothetical protein